MNKINDFVVTSVAYNITQMSNEELQKLAFILSGSVGESLCDYLTFAIQDVQMFKQTEMELVF
jgi:uncharacterized membrane-anchored protein|tara:strand:- start:905 stop:1093 length:189 start_codon:yes stop_codon:yes gene_type:complete